MRRPCQRPGRGRRRWMWVAGASAALVGALAAEVVRVNEARAAAQPETVVVAVDASVVLGPVKPLVFGVNTASWDEQLFPGTMDDWPLAFDQDAVRKVRQAGIRFLRYPGGNDGDRYLWDSPVNSPLRMDTDEFMVLCRLVGAEPSISVNYPAGPEVAARWVQYANREKGYAVRYWEVGDEEYFTVPAAEYARRVVEFSRAMKAVDPTIRVGAGVSVAKASWTLEVLRRAADAIDFVVYNWFPQGPGQESDTALLASPQELRGNLRALRGMLRRAAGERADAIEIHVGGYNSVWAYPGPQSVSPVSAVWTAEVLGVMLEEGVDAAGFWALHNPYPPRGGDYGLLGPGPENRPNPSYWALTLFARHFGHRLVAARSPDPRVAAYASLDDDTGALRVILINKAADRALRVALAVEGFQGQERGVGWLLSDGSGIQRIVPRPHPAEGVELPPYSVASVTVLPAAAPVPEEVPVVRATASSSAELGPAWGPGAAVDGDPRTRWASRIFRDEPEWIELELEQTVPVRGLRLAWERHAVHYRVEVSADGHTWETVYETASGRGGNETVTFPPRPARFVRVHMLRKAEDLGTHTGHSVWTFGAYSLWEVAVLSGGDSPGSGE